MPRSTKLSLEALDDRVVPSATPLPGTGGAGSAQTYHSSHPLAGTGDGTYAGRSLIVDAGAAYHLTGHGTFGALGAVRIDGTIQGVGMIQSGHARGTLTFTTAHGSVTVQLDGPVQGAFAPIPTWFNYHIVHATGHYAALKDQGTLRIDLQPAPGGAHGTPPGHFRIAI